MGRTETFDRPQVIRAAREVFWRFGYESTSIPELEQATGLRRSSLYNSFGSKRGLYDAAVQNYLDEVVRPRLQPLVHDPVSPVAIVEYLVGLREAFLRADQAKAAQGCLLLNSCGAPIVHDPEIARVVASVHAERRAALARGIAARFGTADQSAVDSLTDTVAGLVIAAFTLARVDTAQAAHCIDVALETVRTAEESHQR